MGDQSYFYLQLLFNPRYSTDQSPAGTAIGCPAHFMTSEYRTIGCAFFQSPDFLEQLSPTGPSDLNGGTIAELRGRGSNYQRLRHKGWKFRNPLSFDCS